MDENPQEGCRNTSPPTDQRRAAGWSPPFAPPELPVLSEPPEAPPCSEKPEPLRTHRTEDPVSSEADAKRREETSSRCRQREPPTQHCRQFSYRMGLRRG